jgi:hypothetical protein
MSKFGLYTKNSNESAGHINVVEMPTKTQAEAYFAGVKQLSLTQFQDLFNVKEVKESDRQMLFGNN